MTTYPKALLLCIAAAAAGTALAGTVTVSFTDPARFADAGSSPWDKEANLQALSAHLEELGKRYLPAGQSLTVEVLDVDLAGDTRPARIRGAEIRVLKGRADWPRIALRYTLSADGRVIRSGEETLSDMDYLDRVRTGYPQGALYHEKRLLEQWMRSRFASP